MKVYIAHQRKTKHYYEPDQPVVSHSYWHLPSIKDLREKKPSGGPKSQPIAAHEKEDQDFDG